MVAMGTLGRWMRRAPAWLLLVVILELVTRALVYALAPSGPEAAVGLSNRLGGPRFVEILLVAGLLATASSVTLVWLASLGMRERWDLAEVRPEGAPPRVRLRPLLLRALGLTLAGWLTFASVETVIHLRAGLGFHGLECLVGPGHRNALPVVAALALLASALIAVAQLVLAWMRRTVASFARLRARGRTPLALVFLPSLPVAVRVALAPGAPPRGPPLRVV